MQEALTAVLLGLAPLAAVVGNRVHWNRQPAEAGGLPYVNLTVISDLPHYHSRGASSLTVTRIQVDAWGETLASAKAAALAIEAQLSGWKGAAGGVIFDAVFKDGGRQEAGDTATGERRLARVQSDFVFHWKWEGA